MANEKRLIDAHDLWSDIMMLPHNGDMISSEEVEQAIMDALTVDAVEVVRCKDCVNYQETLGKDSGKPCGYGSCKNPCAMTGIVYDEDFCSYGERRADDRS